MDEHGLDRPIKHGRVLEVNLHGAAMAAEKTPAIPRGALALWLAPILVLAFELYSASTHLAQERDEVARKLEDAQTYWKGVHSDDLRAMRELANTACANRARDEQPQQGRRSTSEAGSPSARSSEASPSAAAIAAAAPGGK
jgi:hypothetical protein